MWIRAHAYINLLRKRKHLHAHVPTHVVEVMWFTEGRFRGFGAHVVAWMSVSKSELLELVASDNSKESLIDNMNIYIYI